MRHLLNAVLLLSLVAAPAARAQTGPQLTQSVVAGGGGASTQGTTRLDGTAGQPGVGASSGGTFSLDAGLHLALGNRPPVHSVPGAQATNEDTALVFSAGNALSVSDPDAGASASVKVTLTALNGTTTLSTTAGLTFTPAGADNDGAGDAQAVFTGNISAVNAALAGLTFNPTADFNGAASLAIQTDDLGHHGEGGARSDTDTVNITVNAVNDQPAADGQSLTTDEEVPVGVTLTGSDKETAAAGLVYTVTAQPSHGTLSGTAPNLTYTPAPGYAGPDSFKFTVTDAGDGAAAPLTSAEATVSIGVAALPDFFVRDARAAEPKSGEAQMLFTVTLERAATSPVSVDFNTSAGAPGPGVAAAGSDYQTAGGTLTFQPGQRVQTVAVTVLHDNMAEPDETFLLQLSNPAGGRVGDGTATGTITAANPSGAILISELRTFGPGAAGEPADDFVEIYNNSDSPVTVAAADGSGGWGLFQAGADCDATPVLVGVITDGTVIPARGHHLLIGGAYSLEAYAEADGELSADIGPNSNVALFSTSDVGNISSATRLDAVGFGARASNNCALLREGNNLGDLQTGLPALGQYSFFRKLCGFVPGVGCATQGTPKDTGDNAADFTFGDVNGAATDAGRQLAAPGPENAASPRKHDGELPVLLLDSTAAAANSPNRVRDLTSAPGNNATYGTLSLRRRVVNRTGGDVTRLRFRISELTTFPAPAGTADLRALSSSSFTASVKDPGTCLASTGSAAVACTVTVEGTTLEQPPGQPVGGGLNSTLAVGTVTLGTPLADGQSVNVQFLLGIEQTGTFRFYIVLEAQP